MGIPALIFLVIYIVVVLILLVFTVFNIYHVVRYALKTRVSISVTVLFIVGLIIIAGFSAYYISQIDWMQTFYFSLF